LVFSLSQWLKLPQSFQLNFHFVLLEHDKLSRRAKNNLIELEYAVQKELEELKKTPSIITKQIERFQSRFREQLQ